MIEKIVGVLEAWQEQDKDYITHFSFQGVAFEIVSKFREWGEEDCPHRTMANLDREGDISLRKRWECPSCWEELSK